MKKIIMIITLLVAGFALAREYTKGKRFDDYTIAGTTYIGTAAINTSAMSTIDSTEMESNEVWMIKMVTTNGIYYAGGDHNAYSYKWIDRTNTTIISYK